MRVSAMPMGLIAVGTLIASLRDIHRSVSDISVPLTRRQVLGIGLRQVLDQRQGREALTLPDPHRHHRQAACILQARRLEKRPRR